MMNWKVLRLRHVVSTYIEYASFISAKWPSDSFPAIYLQHEKIDEHFNLLEMDWVILWHLLIF